MPLHDHYGPEAKYAVEAEAQLPTTKWEEEIARGLELGLQGADSINDKRIPTFSRGELPHFAGINTFLKAPYIEDVRALGEFDVAVFGAPFDGGTTYRPGTRFGPQGIRKISALYGPYNFELGVDLRESMTVCDLGDIFTIPANIEKTFDQIIEGRRACLRSRRLPGRAGRRPLDRLSRRCAALRSTCTAASSASSTSTATSTRRRPTSTSACTRRRGSTPRTSPMCRPRTWYRSASAAGRRRAPA